MTEETRDYALPVDHSWRTRHPGPRKETTVDGLVGSPVLKGVNVTRFPFPRVSPSLNGRDSRSSFLAPTCGSTAPELDQSRVISESFPTAILDRQGPRPLFPTQLTSLKIFLPFSLIYSQTKETSGTWSLSLSQSLSYEGRVPVCRGGGVVLVGYAVGVPCGRHEHDDRDTLPDFREKEGSPRFGLTLKIPC